jgi:two-component system cell cycle response regulator CpdR
MPRILIAEDDEPVRALVARALVEDGHDVVTAPDGAAALETLGRENGRFDVLTKPLTVAGVRAAVGEALATGRR